MVEKGKKGTPKDSKMYTLDIAEGRGRNSVF